MGRIDNNIDDTALNVELGHNEIMKWVLTSPRLTLPHLASPHLNSRRYFQSVTSNRWLMVKIFGVLIFFFLLFVIFMA